MATDVSTKYHARMKYLQDWHARASEAVARAQGLALKHSQEIFRIEQETTKSAPEEQYAEFFEQQEITETEALNLKILDLMLTVGIYEGLFLDLKAKGAIKHLPELPYMLDFSFLRDGQFWRNAREVERERRN